MPMVKGKWLACVEAFVFDDKAVRLKVEIPCHRATQSLGQDPNFLSCYVPSLTFILIIRSQISGTQ